MIVSTSSKVTNDDCFADLLIGEFNLLLYFSKSRARSQNSTIVRIFSESAAFYVYVLRYKFMSMLY